jgi:hypothetical protein
MARNLKIDMHAQVKLHFENGLKRGATVTKDI